MFKKMLLSFALIVFSVVAFLPTNSHAKLADGVYSIQYQVNTAGKNEPSVGNDYFLKPAELTVQNGKMTAKMTVKNSSWVVKLDGPNYKDISTDTAKDTRLFQFEVADLGKVVPISMRVEIPDLSYYHSYTVDFQFDEASAKKTADVAAATNTPTTTTAVTPATSASANVAQQQAAAKAATTPSTTSVTTAPKTATATTTATTTKPTTTSQVKNPQTSDELPYIALFLLCASAFIIVRMRKQTA